MITRELPPDIDLLALHRTEPARYPLLLESVAGGSKSGANDFFSGVGAGAMAMFGEDTGFRGNSDEATAGAAIGAILMLPAALGQ